MNKKLHSLSMGCRRRKTSRNGCLVSASSENSSHLMLLLPNYGRKALSPILSNLPHLVKNTRPCECGWCAKLAWWGSQNQLSSAQNQLSSPVHGPPKALTPGPPRSGGATQIPVLDEPPRAFPKPAYLLQDPRNPRKPS